jgi:plasmid maintenance system killer protein
MHLLRFRHKGLRELYEDDIAKGVPSAMADKLRKLLFAMETAGDSDQVAASRDGGCTLSGATWKDSGA